MKANCIICDCPYKFSDPLRQSKTKRGAEDNYKSVMTNQEILAMDIPSIAADDCVLVLWVPSSMIAFGVECCEHWGFKVTQTFVWVKTKKNPLKSLLSFKKGGIWEAIANFDANSILNFFMGHLFRQTHEIALVAVKGKYTKLMKNKSQRSVCIAPALKHSEKTEILQDRLDIIFPDLPKVELFARRDRPGWKCLGNECPSTYGQEINDSIKKLSEL